MRNFCYFLIILTIGIIARLLPIKNLPFDSDEAIVGLMGKHILEGELPWLYYGDSYGGILEPILASWSFLFNGVSRVSLYLIPFVFSILFIISIYQLGCELYNREIALLSMLLAAVPPFKPGFYSALANGGYIEVLWLGNLILLLTHRLAAQKETLSFLPLFFLGLLWGIAWWTHPLSLIFLFTGFCFFTLINKEWIVKGKVLITVLGFLLGSIPFWIWNIRHQFPFLQFTQSQEKQKLVEKISKFFYQFIEFFNASLKEQISFIALALATLFLLSLVFLIVGKKWLREKFPSSHGLTLLLIFFMSFCFIYVGSRFSEKNALRYILPLYSIIPITLAVFCYALKTISRFIFIGLVAVILIINTYQQMSLITFLKFNSTRYRQQLQVERVLFDFLKKKNYNYAYAPEYWSAAELTFNAKEHPVFTLPFTDRYPLYTLLADASPNPAFVLEGKHRQSFEEMFRAMGGTYKKELLAPYQKIKGYLVCYDFKPPAADYLEILPDRWKGKSNVNSGSEARAFDRNISSSWTSSCPQKPGLFYQVDLGRVYNLNRIVFLSGKGKEWDFPNFYRLELSKNGQDWVEVSSVNNNWGYLFWSGGRPFWKLRDGRMENRFNSLKAQFIKITITAPSPYAWTIGEIFVYQEAEPTKSSPGPAEELISFLSKEKIEYVYADIGLSAQITRFTRGKMKCLQEDYDITKGKDYWMWGYNDPFPYFNKLKKWVDFSLSPAFVVDKENKNSFVRTLDTMKATYSVKSFGDQLVYYGLKFPEPVKGNKMDRYLGTYYWNGTHLLNIN